MCGVSSNARTETSRPTRRAARGPGAQRHPGGVGADHDDPLRLGSTLPLRPAGRCAPTPGTATLASSSRLHSGLKDDVKLKVRLRLDLTEQVERGRDVLAHCNCEADEASSPERSSGDYLEDWGDHRSGPVRPHRTGGTQRAAATARRTRSATASAGVRSSASRHNSWPPRSLPGRRDGHSLQLLAPTRILAHPSQGEMTRPVQRVVRCGGERQVHRALGRDPAYCRGGRGKEWLVELDRRARTCRTPADSAAAKPLPGPATLVRSAVVGRDESAAASTAHRAAEEDGQPRPDDLQVPRGDRELLQAPMRGGARTGQLQGEERVATRRPVRAATRSATVTRRCAPAPDRRCACA